AFNTTTKCFVNISAPSQLVTASYPRANKAILRRRKNDSTDSRLVMERYEEEAEDSDNETDPEQLLNEWLGELDSLTVVSLYFSSRGFFVSYFTVRNPQTAVVLIACRQLNVP
ncbi:hypothetical protein ALC57_14766, partial [Trachymyrmex cornetzi]